MHKFLVETAATLRYAQHAVMPPVGVVVAKAPEAPAAPKADAALVSSEDGSVDLAKVGEHVGRILEAAEALAAGLRADADNEVIAIRAGAEKAAADRRREAEDDARLIREQAKRVLIAAQDQAARIVAEADEEAASLRAAAEQRLQARTEKIQRVASQHADRVVRYEHDAVRRLEEARADLERAIERLTGSESRPVVDLSQSRPTVRTGALPERADMTSDASARVPAPATPTVAEPIQTPGPDPVSNLVRAAVERAVEHSTPRRSRSAPQEGDPAAPPSR